MLGYVPNWEYFVSLLSTKFLCVEVKFTLVNLGRTCQYPGEDMDAYVKLFHENVILGQLL